MLFSLSFPHDFNYASLLFSYQTLSVLTDDQHIQFALVRERGGLDRGNGTDVGVKVEFLAKCNDR